MAALPACSSCERKSEPTVVVVDDGGARPRAHRRPFDRYRRDGGVPTLYLPHSDAASAPPIE
jgi:hypothetical protein